MPAPINPHHQPSAFPTSDDFRTYLFGTSTTTGILTRLDRIERTQDFQRYCFRTIWVVLIGSIGALAIRFLFAPH